MAIKQSGWQGLVKLVNAAEGDLSLAMDPSAVSHGITSGSSDLFWTRVCEACVLSGNTSALVQAIVARGEWVFCRDCGCAGR